MGGAADLPQRSSSPLKRRASDLDEPEVPENQSDDVEMVTVPASGAVDPLTLVPSVDMLRDEIVESSSPESGQSTVPITQPDAETIALIDLRIKEVTLMCETSLQEQPAEGAFMYVVSKLWLQRVLDRGSVARQKSKVEPEGDIGPIDNSDIILEIIKDSNGVDFVQLKPGYGNDHFQLFPLDAWNLILEWYGLMPGSIAIERRAHNTNPDLAGMPNMSYEYHPPIFTVHRLWADNNPIQIPQNLKENNPPALKFVFSRSARYYDFLKTIKAKSQVAPTRKIRLWRVPKVLPTPNSFVTVPNNATPPASRPGSPVATDGTTQSQTQSSWSRLLLDVATFTQLERDIGRELMDGPDTSDISINQNYNGHKNLAFVGLGEDQTIVIDESVDNSSWVSNYVPKANKNISVALTRTGISQSAPTSGRNSPAPSGPMTRGRTQKSGKAQGTVGLNNLGNTCYMNSALQCVRSVEELTKYFLSGTAKSELNTDNPLGNGGNVAMAYGRLLDEIYKENANGTVAPRQFKSTIGKYAPSFSGYGQQDSQEFLGFLLDGLQEDLSRVKKKPYIEKPDSTDDMINNPAAIREMANKVWDITKKRDDSIIADLFTGMYKSTLVCPECAKVSITFDPFNNLTLQLPIENSWSHNIFYFPLNDKPVIITVDMDKQGTILALKEFISKRVGVPTERLFAGEEFKSKFYKIYSNDQVASDEITSNDNVAVYELEVQPTNWPFPRKLKKSKKSSSSLNFGSNDSDLDDIPPWNDPMAEKMLVPVFHRRVNPDRNRFKRQWQLIPAPHFIVVTPEEARDLEIIQRKVLEKIATFTTSSLFQEDDDADASVSDSIDPDIVLTTGSDADSSGDSKVVATSVDGEDELVDVAMNKSDENSPPKNSARSPKSPVEKLPPILKNFNKRRPKFMTPGSYLTPELQNMFSLGFFSGGKEMIPSGWNVVDDDRVYTPLASRAPQPRRVSSESLDGYEPMNGRASSESSIEDDTFRSDVFSTQTRMNEESSEEDELASPGPSIPAALPLRQRPRVRVGFAEKRRTRSVKTYSKKGKLRIQRFSDSNDELEQENQDEGPLIRLGEGIVVDWLPEAFNAMYGREGPQDILRGADTITNIPTLSDPDLEARRKSRQQRRKNGITLDDCLNEFGKEEILSEMDTWYCPRCKEHRRASKKFELWRTPDILVMHLKRFSSNAMRRDKLDVLVDFPVQGLDLTSRVIESQEGKTEIYDLIAVDDHWGGLGGGHYTAYAKNFIDGQWYEYNDTSVSKRNDPQCVVTQSAYLLFYRRRSDVPLGGLELQKIVRNYDNNSQSQEEDSGDSGEERGLVGNTFRGSSSAYPGVEAALRRPNHGSASEDMTISPANIEGLPAYQSHDMNEESGTGSDATMNDGLVQNSIEDVDEGVGMDDEGMNYANVIAGSFKSDWTFDALGKPRGQISGTGSDIEEGSDFGGCASSVDVLHDSSIGGGSPRLDDFADAVAEDENHEPFLDQSPVPDMSEEAQLDAAALSIGLRSDLLQNHALNEFEVPPINEDDEAEEPATEIHIDDV